MTAKFTLVALWLLLAPTLHSRAQLLHIYDISAANFPAMSAKILALDRQGKPARPLFPADVALAEDGTTRVISGISCPPPVPPAPLSSVLVTDVSGSMGEGFPRNIEIAQSAARAWLNLLDFSTSECALTSFDDNGYVVRDFSRDKALLLNDLAGLQPLGGTNYASALLTPPAGGVPVASRGKFKRVVVFLTDGQNDLLPDKIQSIIAAAQAANITIYAVGLRFNLPASVKEITAKTGGLWFENITTEEEAARLYTMIFAVASGAGSCEIAWQSAPECVAEHRLTAKHRPTGAAAEVAYNAPATRTTRLTIIPEQLDFGGVTPLRTADSSFELRADGGDVRISRLIMGSPFFTILNNPSPFTLSAGQSVKIRVRFTPVDSNRATGDLYAETDACERDFGVAGGGFSGKSGGDAIRIVRPNGREKLLAGTDTVIQWTGTLPNDEIILEFSADEGLTWSLITDKAARYRYMWRVPDTLSNTCLIRGRIAQAVAPLADTSFDIPTDAWSVRYSRSGKLLAVTGYSAAGNGTIAYFDVSRGERPNTGVVANVPNEKLSDVDISPDERFAAAFSRSSGTLVIAEIATGAVRQFPVPEQMIGYAGVNYTPDGRFIVTGRHIFDVALGQFTRAYSNAANTGALSPDGRTMAVSLPSGARQVSLRGFADDAELCRTPQHTAPTNQPIYVTTWSADGSTLATAAANNNDLVVAGADCGLKARIPAQVYPAANIALNTSGEILASVYYGDTIKLWDARAGALLRSIKRRIINGAGVPVDFTALAFSPDGRELAAGGNGRVVFIRMDSLTNTDVWRPIRKIFRQRLMAEAHISPDGQQVLALYEPLNRNQIVSRENPRLAVMYDAATGDSLFALDSVDIVSYSRSGRYLLVCGAPFRDDRDSMIHTPVTRFDAATGRRAGATLDKSGLLVSACDLHPDDSLAVIAHGNSVSVARMAGVPAILSTAPYLFLGPLRATLIDNGAAMWVCENGVSQGRTFTLKLNGNDWDVALQTVHQKPGYAGDARPDGLQSSFVSSDFSGVVQGISGGAGFPVGKPVWNVRYSPDSRFALFPHYAGFDTTLNGQRFIGGAGYVFSTNGDLVQTLVDRQLDGWLYHGTFSADSRRVATAGHLTHATGGAVIIWEGAPQGVDRSDTLFAIVKPKAEFHDVDFGDVPAGMTKDTVVTAVLCNRGTFPLLVPAAAFAALPDAEFSLVSGLPAVIQPDSCITLELRFLPRKEGQFTGAASFSTSYGVVGISLRGKGIEFAPAQANAVDFGRVVAGSVKDSLVKFTIRNDGPRSIAVADPTLRGPDILHFSIVSGGGNFTLLPTQSHEMMLRFAPTEVARTSARIVFPFTIAGGSGKEYTLTLPLYGEGVCDANTPAVAVRPAEKIILTETGNYVRIAIVAPGLPPAASLRLRYDRSALLPVDTGATVAVAGGTGYATIPLRPPFAGDTLAVVEFFTALGTTDSAVVAVDNVEFTGCAPPVAADSAVVVMLDICRAGGKRLFDGMAGRVALAMLPNPAAGSAEIFVRLIEQGRTRVELADRLGRAALTLLDGEFPPGERRIAAVFDEIPAGNYTLLLRTPNQVVALPVVIFR